MGDKTGISWTDATWNPVRGCSRVSEGCRNCYAERVAMRFSGEGQPYSGLVRLGIGGDRLEWSGVVRLVPERLADPLRWKKPRRIFVNSMSDLFHEKLTNEQIAAVFGVMAAAPQHTFQVLTKRARRMREWFKWVADLDEDAWTECHAYALARDTDDVIHTRSGEASGRPWPLPNVWLGVSVENQEAADERITELLRTPAAVRFLSCEPLIGDVNIRGGLGGQACLDAFDGTDALVVDPSLDWVIAGCESGSRARDCRVEWLRSLRDQCAAAGVAYFLKQAVETEIGRCGRAANPNGDRPCGERIRAYVISPDTAAYSCGCTVEGPEDGACVPLGAGEGSKRKSGGVIELPYLDGVQHAAFPESR